MPTGAVRMNAEEMELLNDPKYRSYAATLDKALKSFEYSSEWADLISALGKLNKVLQGSSKYPVLPRKLTIGKRLAQCLHPALPSGVHLKALETYEIIFRIIGSKRLARDLFLYSAGLFPLLANAAMSVRPALLQLYETYYVPLGKTLKPGLQGLVTAILPGLEEGSEYYDRSNCLLEKTSLAVEPCVFFSALWGSVLTSPAVRLPAVTYTLTHLNRKLSMEDQLHVIGTDVDLMVEAVCACVQDSSVLVQRSTLDLLLFCFPFHHSQVTKLDTVRLLSAVLHVVLRRDMSLNRRLYAWLLGFDNNGTALGPRMARDESREEHGARYFSTYSRELLVQAMVGILKGRGGGGCGEEGGSVSPDLRPFRILLSLLDKPEIGPAILEEVLVEVFRALHGQCEMELGTGIQPLFSKDRSQLSSKMRENKQTAEVVKTANLLFNSFEPYYLWDYLARLFQSCCRRSRRGVRRARRPSGMSEQELTVCELCVLADFLLDVVSLESYIEIQTEHLPRLLRRLIGCLTRHLASLSLTELTDSLRLCSKILSRVQPPLVPVATAAMPVGPGDDHRATVGTATAERAEPSEEGGEASGGVGGDSGPAPAAGPAPARGPPGGSSFTEFVQYSGGRGEHPGAGTGSRERQEGGARESPKELRGCSDGAGSGSERSRSSSESPPAARRRPGDPARHDGALAGTGDADPDEDEEEGEEEEVDDGGEEVYKDSDDDEGDEGERRQRQHKTTMQRCCERFQEFLTLFSRRYVLRSDGAPAQFVRDISLGGALTGAGALAVWGKRSGRTADGEAGGGGPRGEDDGGSDGTAAAAADGFSEGHLAALAAACQLLLECSSFPVYVAEGSPASPHRALPAGTGDTTGVLPEWLQTLLACCCYGCGGGGGGSDAGLSGSEAFPVRGTAIACFLDLLHLARSVSAVAVSSPQQQLQQQAAMAYPSPASPGRVAVVIVPPLTDAHLRYLAEKTRFFQMVAAILWAQLGEGGGGRHHRRCVELLQQLHGLAPGPSVCEDVVSRDLASRVPATRVEAYRKFALLWHLTRDLQQSKNWAFTRTFDRSLLLMLDSLRCVESDGQCASVCHEWLTHAVQRHDVPRLLEPPLLLLLHPKTQRVSLAAVALRQSGAGTGSRALSLRQLGDDPRAGEPLETGADGAGEMALRDPGMRGNGGSCVVEGAFLSGEAGAREVTGVSVCVRASGDHAGYYVTERVARGGSSVAHGGPRVPVGLTVNPLGADSESPLSSSPPSASHAKEGPGAADDEDDGGCGDDDDDTGSTHGVSTRSRSDSGVSDRTGDSSLADEEVDEADEADEDEEEEEGRVVCRDIDPEVCRLLEDVVEAVARLEGGGEAETGDAVDGETRGKSGGTATTTRSVPADPSRGGAVTAPCGTVLPRPSSFPLLAPGVESGAPRSRSSSTLDQGGGGARPKVRHGAARGVSAAAAPAAPAVQDLPMRLPPAYLGEAGGLEAWYGAREGDGTNRDSSSEEEEEEGDSDSCSPRRATRRMGGGNHGNAAAPSSSLGVTERSVATVHPLYQHVLLYLQVYDTGRVLHALAVLGSVLRSIPAAFVSALATTGVSGARAPRLVLLQNLLARHRASFTGGDFYASAHGPGVVVSAEGGGAQAGGFRNAMYLEVVLSLGLAFLRSYYPHHVRASPRQLSENRHVQLASAEVLTLLVSALARLVDSGCTGAGGTGSASSSGPGFASFLLDLLARCKAQKVVLHCLVAGVAGAHARAQAHVLSVRNDPAAEEGLSMEGKVNFFEDGEEEEEESGEGSAGASGEGTSGALQAQLLRLLQALMVLEHKVLACTEDPEGGFTELVAAQPENPPSNHQQHQQEHQQHQQEQAVGPAAPTSLRFVSSRPLAEQEMLGWAVTRALLVSAPPGRASCAAHPRWVGAVTASLPYLGRALARLAVAVVAQVCRNLDAAAQQHAWESALAADRPDVLLESVPPDYVLCLLEGLTTVVHYCLLDSSTTHIHSPSSASRAEARAAMLCVLPCVLSTAALLWSLLGKAEGQRVEVVAGVTGGAAAPSSVGLGSTKILRQKVLDLLSPLSLQHGVAFMAAVARVWSERTRGRPAASRSRVCAAEVDDRPRSSAADNRAQPRSTTVLAAANVDQQLLVDLIRGISSMRTDSVVGTVKEVVRQPPSGPAPSPKEKSVPLEVSVLQFFFAYVQRIAVSQFVDSWPSLLSLLKDCSALNLPPPGHFLLLGILNEFVMKMPPMESKKDLRDLQDVTQRLVEAVTHVAGSSLEQTTWLRRNLEVKAGPQVTVDAAGLQADADDALLLSPVAEVVSQPPSVFSVHALTLLAEVLAHLLDMVFRSDEKEKVVPLLINIMYYVVPYLKNHSAHNAPSFRACVQLLSSLSGYQYTRRAWKKEALDLFMESTFFQMDASCVPQWRSIIDHLMTHDKTTFRDLMTRVTVAQSSSLNLFGNREAELEQRVMLLKRLAFSVFSSEVDQYHKFLPDIQERLVESLRLPQVPTLHAQVFLFFRVLLLRVSHQHLTALWPAMITELVQVFMQMEQELMAEDDITRSASPSITGLETTYVGGNGFSSSYSQQRWLALYLSACKFLDLALALPSAHLPQFQLYRWAFIPETCDDSGLEVRRQGNHQREFRPYVVRLTKLLRKKCKKSSEEEGGGSPRMIPCEAGQPLLTVASLRSIDQLLPFFSTLSHFFCNKPMVGAAQAFLCDPGRPPGSGGSGSLASSSSSALEHAGSGESGAGAEAQWSRARRRVEETVGRDFLETLNKG
ncbi:protein DOP1A isoform X1 [Lampetra fluviatilis]